jgi:hypothetical protein
MRGPSSGGHAQRFPRSHRARDSPVDPAALEPSAEAPAPVTDRIAGHILTSTTVPGRSFNFGGSFVGTFEHTESTTGYVLEVAWAPNSDFTEQLSLWVRPAGVGAIDPTNPNLVTGAENIVRLDGGSPLRLAIPAADFPEPGMYEWVVRATGEPAGVAVSQTFLMHFTPFDGMAFDEAFTDLPADEEGR